MPFLLQHAIANYLLKLKIVNFCISLHFFKKFLEKNRKHYIYAIFDLVQTLAINNSQMIKYLK